MRDYLEKCGHVKKLVVFIFKSLRIFDRKLNLEGKIPFITTCDFPNFVYSNLFIKSTGFVSVSIMKSAY